MKYISEYRHPDSVMAYAEAIHGVCRRPWNIMEICGGQTHAIMQYGLDQLLPQEVQLIHGPGCPVCVTPVEIIDQAIELSLRKDVVICSFGDMLRVPGSKESLLTAQAQGANVRIVYSPMDALKLANQSPNQQIVFLAIGFETTAPANAMAIHQAKQQNLKNFSALISHVLVPPAIEALLNSPHTTIHGFLAAGHVCMIMGYREYLPLVKRYSIPIVVTGFEPLDIMQGIYMCLEQLEKGIWELQNQYSRVVSEQGNIVAQQILQQVFEVVPRCWRGIGEITQSGLGLRSEYHEFDAQRRFSLVSGKNREESTECISGLVLQGIKKPDQCPAFGKQCTPETPLGATMVSSEGACAAYYRYRSRFKH